MVLLWEHQTLTVKELGDQLFLDSGTLTPLLKKLESKGFVTRMRSTKDERNLNVSVTEAGLELRDRALDIPANLCTYNPLNLEEMVTMYRLLYKMLGQEDVELPDWYTQE
jgi:DNA-binding MarR family transcriptional regulator